MTMENEKALMTVPEVAKYLGVSEPYAYQMAHEGKLPTVVFHKQIYVSRTALEKMLSEVKPENPSQ